MRGGSYSLKGTLSSVGCGACFHQFLLICWRLEALVVRAHWEERAEKIAAKVSDNPHDASRAECYRSPVPFVVGEWLV